MSNAKGLKCSRSRFWKLLRNPIYCGYVSLRSTESDEIQLIKGIHEALIPEVLFYEVQNIINTKRKIVGKAHEINEMFMLRKYLICPVCNRKLSGSFSKGKTIRAFDITNHNSNAKAANPIGKYQNSRRKDGINPIISFSIPLAVINLNELLRPVNL